MNYAIVFVLSNQSNNAYVCLQCIYKEKRSFWFPLHNNSPLNLFKFAYALWLADVRMTNKNMAIRIKSIPSGEMKLFSSNYIREPIFE